MTADTRGRIRPVLPVAPVTGRLRRALAAVALAWLALLLLAAPRPAQACTAGGCVSAGAHLASVSSTQSALLNGLLGGLLGTNLSVTAADWNSIATGNVSMSNVLASLQTTLGVSSPQTALNTPITLGQLTGALGTAATQAGNTSLSAALGDLGAQVSVPGTIKLGDLLTSDGLAGNSTLNVLNLVDGAVQLYNTKNVLTTPTPITISGTSLGLSGVLSSVQLQAQVIEPQVSVCGPVGSTFHTSQIRVKLAMTLVSLTPSSTALNVVALGSSVTLGQMTIYVEIGEASGAITAVNAVSNALSVQVTPGVASLYLGSMADSVFFDRSHTLVAATDLGYGTIGSLTILGQTVGILAKAAAIGTAPTATTLSFSGTTAQTQTAYTGASFATNLVTTLFGNLQLSLSPSLGTAVNNVVLPLLGTIVSTALTPVLNTLTTGLINPLLSELGMRLGEVDVTANGGGDYLECAVSGCVYADANHNARQDSGELGIGTTLYAKLVSPAAPTVAAQVATVDATTGNYSFATLNPAAYTVVISTSSAASVVTPAAPAGWIGTETPTLSRAITVTTLDLTAQRFGLYHGSTLAGTVFKDNGAGSGGIADNGLKDGGETAIGGTLVNVTDTTGATVYDSQRSDATGAYQLWIPSSAGTGVLKVAQAADATMTFVSGRAGTTGGAFALSGATTSFTHVVGSAYTGVDFGDVPINRLDTDGQQSVAAGTTALYAHVFHAGSGGQLTLSAAPAATVPTGWSATIYLDANCNGQLDSGEAVLAAATPVVADQALCVIVKVFVPQTAANDTRATYALTATFAYANSTLTAQAQRQDLTIVGAADGLRLVKTVDKTVAVSGDVITYTVTFLNQGAAAVSALKVRDATPAWTVLDGATCGTLPAGLTCAVSASPAVGAAGSVEWTLGGTLASGGTGTVVFTVRVM